MLRFTLALMLLSSALACAPDGARDDDREADLARAEEAMAALGGRLIEDLTSALDASGPSGAVTVCRDVAPGVASEVSTETGVLVGRTSHRLRNPDNTPPEWASEIVRRSAGTMAESAERHVVELDGGIGVLAPIGTLGLCTTCHGDRQTFEPQLRAELDRAYPDDQATGFAVGDLRGWMWAEVWRDP